MFVHDQPLFGHSFYGSFRAFALLDVVSPSSLFLGIALPASSVWLFCMPVSPGD